MAEYITPEWVNVGAECAIVGDSYRAQPKVVTITKITKTQVTVTYQGAGDQVVRRFMLQRWPSDELYETGSLSGFRYRARIVSTEQAARIKAELAREDASWAAQAAVKDAFRQFNAYPTVGNAQDAILALENVIQTIKADE